MTYGTVGDWYMILSLERLSIWEALPVFVNCSILFCSRTVNIYFDDKAQLLNPLKPFQNIGLVHLRSYIKRRDANKKKSGTFFLLLTV
jgi:hypothetical protein